VKSTVRRLLGLAAVWALGSGCVYYNGVYNAQRAAKLADARLARDEDDDAKQKFRESAQHAETVLVRHPTSRWVSEVLYLSGRGLARAGECEAGLARLSAFLATPGVRAAQRNEARLALAVCDVQAARYADAEARLDSLAPEVRGETARQVRLLKGRVALARGDLDAATAALSGLNSDLLPWELITRALETRDYVRAESLLQVRATRGDYRRDVVRIIRELSAAGEIERADRTGRQFITSRMRDADRAQLWFTLGDQMLGAGRDSIAREYLRSARGLTGRDSALARDVMARALVLDVRRVNGVRSLDSLLSASDPGTWNALYSRRLRENVLLFRMLLGKQDVTGAARYLAAEVARDSLRAAELAASLFVEVARATPPSPLAPLGWYAAAQLQADSAEYWRQRIVTQHAGSAVAVQLRGEDPSEHPEFFALPELLRSTWTESVRSWSDSVARLRQATRTTTP
jgi:hypothetical protein